VSTPREIREIFELIENIKKIKKIPDVNFYIPIYSDADIRTENIKFPEKYELLAERAGREILTGIKNSARPQSPSKRRKLTRS
jgi:hypothetical protein